MGIINNIGILLIGLSPPSVRLSTQTDDIIPERFASVRRRTHRASRDRVAVSEGPTKAKAWAGQSSYVLLDVDTDAIPAPGNRLVLIFSPINGERAA
jgi:hypothetical protein